MIIIPFQNLSPEALLGVIEEFVTRDGTLFFDQRLDFSAILGIGLIMNSIQSIASRGFGITEGHVHHYAIMLGYAKPRYFRQPERKTSKIHCRGLSSDSKIY